MKFKIKIAKLIKLADKHHSGNIYEGVETYLYNVEGEDCWIQTIILNYAFYKLAKKANKSDLKVNIFVDEPKFTNNCPADLVKPEYRGFVNDSRAFLQLLQLAGVEKFTLNLDAVTEANAEYTTDTA